MMLWLLVKLFVLYTISFVFSLSFYLYLSRVFVPPHRTLQFPLIWRDGTGVVELETGQRLGGNFYLKRTSKNAAPNPNSLVIHPNVPYDISLLLKYPDRPEVADLGNLKISMRLVRSDGKEAGRIETVQSLRYETKILRLCREILNLPAAIWKDCGSERIERIALVEKMIDDESSPKGKEKNFLAVTPSSTSSIDRVEISIVPLPPIHSAQLEILANLSPLQHFLFYWRVPTAIFIIGGTTAILWFLVSLYAFVEIVKIVINLRKKNDRNDRDGVEIKLDEVEEFEQVLKEAEDQFVSDKSGADAESDADVEVINFPPAESVANFIGDLRKRRLKEEVEDEGDLIEEIGVDANTVDITADVAVDEDQSVPNEMSVKEE